jgi:hypothetical protein
MNKPAREPDTPFFVGWSTRSARQSLRFIAVAAAAILFGAAALGFAIGAAAPDPGNGDYRFPEVTLTGVIDAKPVPILRLPAEGERKTPHAIMLSTEGTNGAEDAVAGLDGKRVEVYGLLIKRGDIDMLEIADDGIKPIGAAPIPLAAPVPLGRWRITGEICDGKCYTGAMRPGNGIAHKACAGICFVGGVPAVFVSTGAVEGSSFMLMVDEKSGRFVDAFRDLAALRIAIEGELERIDDLLVFRADPATAKVL